ncbi:MAG: inorganic phosphate transporter [Gemmatimonadota bacterium]
METVILGIAIVGGLYMAWNIGANDVANAMGTSVGSGALTLTGAIVVAGIFEFGGAVLVGSHVTDTVRKGIIEVAMFEPTGPFGPDGPLILALGMLSALIAAGAWLHLATHLSLPVSTTHSIVGAVVGIGVASFGWAGVDWSKMLEIMMSWVVSPLLGGFIAWTTFVFIRKRILQSGNPVAATRRVSPYLISVVLAVMILSLIYKALGNVMEAPPFLLAMLIASMIGVMGGTAAGWLIRRSPPRQEDPYVYVERIFARLQIATACFVALAHGANDVANAVGPLAAVADLHRAGFEAISTQVAVPMWVLMLGGGGIVLGLATMGYRVIATIGKQITEMTPTRGFSAEFGAATTVLIASRMGLPVSTTHTLVGSVVGVGFAHGMGALNMRVIRNIVNSWLATVPAAALAAAAIFTVARLIFV